MGLTFQPISSESGLRRNLHTVRDLYGKLFNPYPAKADCDCGQFWVIFQVFLFSTHIQRKRIATVRVTLCAFQRRLFNPYPAKADCDSSTIYSSTSLNQTFQPISSESGLRHSLRHLVLLYRALFNPYPAKADCDSI